MYPFDAFGSLLFPELAGIYSGESMTPRFARRAVQRLRRFYMGQKASLELQYPHLRARGYAILRNWPSRERFRCSRNSPRPPLGSVERKLPLLEVSSMATPHQSCSPDPFRANRDPAARSIRIRKLMSKCIVRFCPSKERLNSPDIISNAPSVPEQSA